MATPQGNVSDLWRTLRDGFKMVTSSTMSHVTASRVNIDTEKITEGMATKAEIKRKMMGRRMLATSVAGLSIQL